MLICVRSCAKKKGLFLSKAVINVTAQLLHKHELLCSEMETLETCIFYDSRAERVCWLCVGQEGVGSIVWLTAVWPSPTQTSSSSVQFFFQPCFWVLWAHLPLMTQQQTGRRSLGEHRVLFSWIVSVCVGLWVFWVCAHPSTGGSRHPPPNLLTQDVVSLFLVQSAPLC